MADQYFGVSDPQDPNRGLFRPGQLDRSIIAVPLLAQLADRSEQDSVSVVFDLNLLFPRGEQASGLTAAGARVVELLNGVRGRRPGLPFSVSQQQPGSQYVLATLSPVYIREVVVDDLASPVEGQRAIFHVWPDFQVRAQLDASVATVKADAARASFAATGRGIVWAVLDSGVCVNHPHFDQHGNCRDLPPGLEHRNFTTDGQADEDPFGHGTHVAGIIAGEATVKEGFLSACRSERDQDDRAVPRPAGIRTIRGVAPECKILSYRVLNESRPRQLRRHPECAARGVRGKQLRPAAPDPRRQHLGWVHLQAGMVRLRAEPVVHGGRPVGPQRRRRRGVGREHRLRVRGGRPRRRPRGGGRALTINDPGNAELAITVGSTHRDSPHLYGVSYFSSKGPTGDGRAKPDLVAPGERILSAGAGTMRDTASGNGARLDYIEHSGTSMAAPHVSGAIAAFLSVRREFIGRPERVKQVFTETATDLGRVHEFQGHGLVDLMRAIQYV